MKGMQGIIFSIDKKVDMRDLTAIRVVGSVPVAGDYRIVDFALSNLVNAGVTDVGIVMHGKCQSMMDHLGVGKSWDMSRNHGGMKLMPAFAYNESRTRGDEFWGKMDALHAIRGYLKDIRHDYVVLLDSDEICNIPLNDVLDAHIASGADITAVCTVDSEVSTGCTYLKCDETGKVIDVAYEVANPEGYRSLNIYILGKELLLKLTDECYAHNKDSFRGDVLQEKKDELNIRGWVWDGYAASIDSIKKYYDFSMELLNPEVRQNLFCAERPIYNKDNDAPSSYIDPALCTNSLIADGCNIQGKVTNSVIFRGVRIEEGAEVDGCILFKDTVVRKNAVLHNIITDKDVIINENTQLFGSKSYPSVIAKGSKV